VLLYRILSDEKKIPILNSMSIFFLYSKWLYFGLFMGPRIEATLEGEMLHCSLSGFISFLFIMFKLLCVQAFELLFDLKMIFDI